jgi:sugar phosphate isomerase/epimerase
MNQGPFINAPFDILAEKLDLLIRKGLMPEIYFNADILDTINTEKYRAVAARLEQHGTPCTFHAPFEDLRPASFDNKIREISMKRLMDTCKIAEIFHPQVIVCHTGFWDWIHFEKENEWLERAVESWGPLCNAAKKAGTRILLENVFDQSPDMLSSLVKQLGKDNAGICLDIGHLTCFTKHPLAFWLEKLGSHIEELHLHDNHGTFDEHLVMGRGNIDFDPLFQYIKKHEMLPIYTLEQHREEDIEPNLLALHFIREKFGL